MRPTWATWGAPPDHVASTIAGMFMGLERFAAYDPDRAAALADYYAFARDNDVYLSYVIINPQADRSKPASQQKDPYLTVGVVDSDGEGLTVRGAKMLATGAVMANEILVTSIQPLAPDESRYALSFVAPMNLPGLKVLSRRSYEAAAPSVFDYPLSARYDENDAVIYFDDAKIPWERVLVNQDVAMTLAQFHETPAHVWQNYQAQVRLSVKLRFLAGLARRMAETNGLLAIPQVRETLGQIAAEAQLVRPGGGHGGGRQRAVRLLHPRRAHALHGAGDHPAALQHLHDPAPRPGRRRRDHAPLLRRRLRQRRAALADRAHPAVAGGHRRRAGEALQAGVGRHRLGVRVAPRAVRDVLRRRHLRHEGPLVPPLRLGRRNRTRGFGVVAATVDRVLVMYAGQPMEHCSIQHLFDRANHPYTEGLLRLVPRFDHRVHGRLRPIEGQPPALTDEIVGCPFAPRCELVEDRCRSERPELVRLGPEHLSACWLATERAQRLTPPGKPWGTVD